MRIQFGLSWVLVAFTVAAFSLAVFGLFGIVVGTILLGNGAYVHCAESRQKALRNVTLGVLLVFVLDFLAFPPVDRAYEASLRSQCANNLKQIGIALHNYRDEFRAFPPVQARDAEGKPLHSWRALVEPYLENSPVFGPYDLNEPWNGPKNSECVNKMPEVYGCQMDGAEAQQGMTRYVAVVGAEGTWLEPTMGDKESNPVCIVETGTMRTWLEPRDVSLESICQATRESSASGLGSKHTIAGFFHHDQPVANALFADGHVRSITPGVPVDVLRAALLGDRTQQEELATYAAAMRGVNWPNCASLAGLLVSFIAMLAWPRRRPAELSTASSGGTPESVVKLPNEPTAEDAKERGG